MTMSAEPRHMTPEEVLHVLRHIGSFVSSRASAITFETPLNELQPRDSEIDLPQEVAYVLHAPLLTRSNRDEVIEKTRSMAAVIHMLMDQGDIKTVGDLCRELCVTVSRTPVIEFRFLDQPCPAGSIFLTLQRELEDRAESFPRSPSAPVRITPALLIAALRIAPCRLPQFVPSTDMDLYQVGNLLGCLTFFMCLCVGLIGAGGAAITFAFVGLFVSICIATTGIVKRMQNGPGRWTGIITYRDLCKTLAGEPVARGAIAT
jgi:hypothetical protein